jgi:hypothetical protein
MSGIASMGSFVTEYVPHPINARIKSPIMNLFLTENEMIRFIII